MVATERSLLTFSMYVQGFNLAKYILMNVFSIWFYESSVE